MYTEITWLFVIIGIATSQQEGNVGEKTQTGNHVDLQMNDETDAATDALANYLGFSCPLGHRCLPVLDCLPCEFGTYKDNDGSALCKKCPPDCTTLRKGAQSREECVPFCPPGYERSQCGQTCTKCRPGTYKSSWNGTELCIKCPENSSPSDDALGLVDVEQCYTDGEDPVQSTTESVETTSGTVPSYSGRQSTPQETVTDSTDEWSTTPDECVGVCPLPPPEESDLCSETVNQLFGCLNRCSVVNDVVEELNEARKSLHNVVKNKLTDIVNTAPDWRAIFVWFHSECPEYTTATSDSTSTTTPETPPTTLSETTSSSTITETPETPTSSKTTTPSETTSSEGTVSRTTVTPETPTGDSTTTSSTSTVTEFTEETTTASDTSSGDTPSTTTEPIPPPEQISTVMCSQDIQCGLGGRCYDGYCGCLTTKCSGVAYAAMQGCQYFCHCNDATKKWEMQPCAPGTLFDEMYPANCNHDYLVGIETCYHAMICGTDYCVMPEAAEDMCDLYVRNYTRCLRSLAVNCNRRPQDEHMRQATNHLTTDVIFNELRNRMLTYEEDAEQFYVSYMRECFEYTTTTSDSASTTTTETPPTTSSKMASSSISSGDTPSTTTEPIPPPEQMSTVMCSQDIQCGLGGRCYGDYCGCLTTNCSGVAYAAMQGCEFYCQCNDATKKWELQPCSPGTLFDEMYPGTCNYPYLVGNETCYHAMNCDIDYCVMPAASVDMCDLYVRNYTRCLRSLHATCGRHPLSEHIEQETSQLASDVIYNKLRELLSTYEENVEQFYIDYMTECFERASLTGA